MESDNKTLCAMKNHTVIRGIQLLAESNQQLCGLKSEALHLKYFVKQMHININVGKESME